MNLSGGHTCEHVTCYCVLQTIESFAAQEKQMEVCEVCGAFLIVGDAQSRVDDHLMGKQHMGYAKIKSTVEELKVQEQARWTIRNNLFGEKTLVFTDNDANFVYS